MSGLILRRLLTALPLVLAVLTLVFLVVETAPGDPADLMLGDSAVPPQVRERLERAYGFDRSPIERYLAWLAAVAQGDLGWSHSNHRPVAESLVRGVGNTLILTLTALAIHLAAGILLGIVSALYRGRWPDGLVTISSLTVYAMPTFWRGLMAVLLFALWIPLFPASSMRSVDAGSWSLPMRGLDLLWHLVLPACTLGFASAAATARFVRSGLLHSLGQEFVRAARARGLGGGRVMLVYGLRNAMIPVINLLGLSLPVLVSGSLVVEVVFGWPGMGRLTYAAILARDIPMVLGGTLVAAVMVIVGNLLADIAMAVLDPRIRLGRAGDGS
ncbi:MAG: ABC transporter permease [Acidobacteriota bacterium]|nr:ABC transporter permease [Acidobacteriota bacterium]